MSNAVYKKKSNGHYYERLAIVLNGSDEDKLMVLYALAGNKDAAKYVMNPVDFEDNFTFVPDFYREGDNG